MIDLLSGWVARYPILSIEDPLAEDDLEGFVAFSRAVGDQGADRRRRFPGDATRTVCAMPPSGRPPTPSC